MMSEGAATKILSNEKLIINERYVGCEMKSVTRSRRCALEFLAGGKCWKKQLREPLLCNSYFIRVPRCVRL